MKRIVLLALFAASLSTQSANNSGNWEADASKIGQSSPGGFDYNTLLFTAAEVGDRINGMRFDYSETRTLRHAPAPGIHPRIYMNPEDRDELLNRLRTTNVGKEQWRVLHAYTSLLNLGYNDGGLYKKGTAYSQNSQKREYIGNPGSFDVKAMYDRIAAPDAPKGLLTTNNKITPHARFGSQMSAEAWICYLNNPDDISREAPYPSTFKLTYRDRAQKLAHAMTYWAQAWLDLYRGLETGINVYDQLPGGCMTFSVMYDMNYWAMTDAQRSVCREALAKVCSQQPIHFAYNAPYATVGNWVGLDSFEAVPFMAIEGETGYNPTGLRNWVKSLYQNINYGCYKDGFYFEAIGKGYLMMGNLIALARRGYSFLGHPHVRRFCDTLLPQITVTHGYSFLGDDLYGGHDGGQTSAFPMLGRYHFHSIDAVGLNFAYPQQAATSFVWRNYVCDITDGGTEFVDLTHGAFSPGTHNYFDRMNFTIVYGDDWYSGPNKEWSNFENHQRAAFEGRPDYFSDGRGVGIMRSGFDRNALYVQMNSRQNFGGHTSPDKNAITLNALGRIWFYREAADKAFQAEYFSCPMVDNKGAKLSPNEGTKAKQPVKVLSFRSDDLSCIMAADATDAYNYEWDWKSGGAPAETTAPTKAGWTPITDWNFNRYLLNPVSGDIMFSQPFYNYPYWMCDKASQQGYIEQMCRKEYNTLDRIVRTTAMVRAEKPYLVLVDDIRKRSGTGNFKSLFQLAADLEQENITPAPKGATHLYDVIIREKQGIGRGRRLLVRVFGHNGHTLREGAVETIRANVGLLRNLNADYGPVGDTICLIGTNPLKKVIRTRLMLEADNVLSPDFKLLVMPLEASDPLPMTHWNKETGELKVWQKNSTQATQVTFDTSSGYTSLSISRCDVPTTLGRGVEKKNDSPRLVGREIENLRPADRVILLDGEGRMCWDAVASDNKLTLPQEKCGTVVRIVRAGKTVAALKYF